MNLVSVFKGYFVRQCRQRFAAWNKVTLSLKRRKTVLMLCTNASKQSKERKCSPAPNSKSLWENIKAVALHMILNSILLLKFLLGNIVNGEMNNKCSSAVFICMHWLDKHVIYFFSFFFFSSPKLLNQPLWSPLAHSASADIKFVILEYKLPLLLRTLPLSHSFPPCFSFIVCLCLHIDQYDGRAETLLCALDVPH